jgi:hypothetical protein
MNAPSITGQRPTIPTAVDCPVIVEEMMDPYKCLYEKLAVHHFQAGINP